MHIGAYMWKDFQGPAQLVSESFKEIDDIPNIGQIDAAFRMHNNANPDDHDRIYFFLVRMIVLCCDCGNETKWSFCLWRQLVYNIVI